MMSSGTDLANSAWEAVYRAQATISRELIDLDIWEGLTRREYAVLMALAAESDGLRVTELGQDVLITQPGMSKLVGRLVGRGLVERCDDDDGRARRVRLTAAGARLQSDVGAAIAAAVERIMSRALSQAQQQQLRDLAATLLAGASSPYATIQQKALKRRTR